MYRSPYTGVGSYPTSDTMSWKMMITKVYAYLPSYIMVTLTCVIISHAIYIYIEDLENTEVIASVQCMKRNDEQLD